jgi:cell division protein FtsZ
MAAAEAAISNPLLDETSMRGARGLLISITGGRDLTLIEVDEAATRIREEVDGDANIILGATFEESLEGIIRVSVVATGIDRAAQAEMDRNDQSRIHAVSRPAASAPAPQPATPPAPRVLATATAPRPATTPVRATAAPVAPAYAPAPAVAGRIVKGGVAIEPLQPAAHYTDTMIEEDFRTALEDELSVQSAEFIPPAPELPDAAFASTRMPEVEDFPPMVQSELQSRGAQRAPVHEERGPIGLLRKLAHGFGVREEAHHETHEQAVPQRQAAPQGVRQEPQAHVVRQRQAAQPAAGQNGGHPGGIGRVDDNPFAPRRAALDRTGRINPSERPVHEDDQLEIPAFLRRQSS